jgi:hypothetical protein
MQRNNSQAKPSAIFCFTTTTDLTSKIATTIKTFPSFAILLSNQSS